MTYGWEKNAAKMFFEGGSIDPGSGLQVVGIAVENTLTGEGALIKHPSVEWAGCVVQADVWQDIYWDAATNYDEALEVAFEGFDE